MSRTDASLDLFREGTLARTGRRYQGDGEGDEQGALLERGQDLEEAQIPTRSL